MSGCPLAALHNPIPIENLTNRVTKKKTKKIVINNILSDTAAFHSAFTYTDSMYDLLIVNYGSQMYI